MNRILHFFFCGTLCLALCSCSKDDLSPLEQLPPITSKGANTFGCLINGEPMVVTNITKMFGEFIRQPDTSLGLLPFDSSDMHLQFSNNRHEISFFLNDPMVRQYWNFSNTTLPFPVLVVPKDYVILDGVQSSENTKGNFTSNNFKADGPIFSGTFELECINPRTCQTMKITEGRLDVNLNQLQ